MTISNHNEAVDRIPKDSEALALEKVLFVLEELKQATRMDDNIRGQLQETGVEIDSSAYIKSAIDGFYREIKSQYDSATADDVQFDTPARMSPLSEEEILPLWQRIDNRVVGLGERVGRGGDLLKQGLRRQTKNFREALAISDDIGRHKAIGTLAIGTVLGINFISPKPAQAQEHDSQPLKVETTKTSLTRSESDKSMLGDKIVNLVPKKTTGKHERNNKPTLTVKLSSDKEADS